MNDVYQKLLKQQAEHIHESAPIILNLSEEKDKKTLSDLLDAHRIQHVTDDYAEQQKEYFQVMHPSSVYAPGFAEKFQAYFQVLQEKMPLWQCGRWVYFPWLSTVAHLLEDDAFQLVRMARNRNLINKEEQKKFYNAVVGIAGLSVGNGVALAMVLQGGARYIRLADHDRLALSNLNRIRAGVEHLGILKTEMTARQIYMLNPYATVEIFSEGLHKENIDRFFEGPQKLDIIIDEIDNLAVKYLIREQAQKRKLAVVMGADNGDNVVIDIERYDENPNQEFFHGRMGEVTYESLVGLDKFGTGKKITQHIGMTNITESMLRSLLEMGKTVVSWPQLGGAALMNGSAIAYCVRKILNKQPLENNRALISLDEKLIPYYNGNEEAEKREKTANEFKKIFKL